MRAAAIGCLLAGASRAIGKHFATAEPASASHLSSCQSATPSCLAAPAWAPMTRCVSRLATSTTFRPLWRDPLRPADGLRVDKAEAAESGEKQPSDRESRHGTMGEDLPRLEAKEEEVRAAGQLLPHLGKRSRHSGRGWGSLSRRTSNPACSKAANISLSGRRQNRTSNSRPPFTQRS